MTGVEGVDEFTIVDWRTAFWVQVCSTYIYRVMTLTDFNIQALNQAIHICAYPVIIFIRCSPSSISSKWSVVIKHADRKREIFDFRTFCVCVCV